MTRNRLARATVLRTEPLTPSMRRLVLGGDDVEALIGRWNGWTDAYVKLAFLPPGVDYPEPLDLDQIKAERPSEEWPVLRTYTLRRVDAEAGEVWIDVVIHGDQGLAGPWAARAEVGAVIHLRGPGGAYRPDPAADVHLYVGDESALPAIAASLEALPVGARAVAFVEVAGPEHQIELPTPAEAHITWLARGDAAPGSTDLLDQAVRAWPWPDGRVQAFVHGESALLKTVRPYLLTDRGVSRRDLSVSAYWRRGETEEGFRAWKATQSEPILRPEADLGGSGGSAG